MSFLNLLSQKTYPGVFKTKGYFKKMQYLKCWPGHAQCQKNLDKVPIREPTPEPAIEPEVTIEPTKATKAKTKRRMSSLKLREKLLN